MKIYSLQNFIDDPKFSRVDNTSDLEPAFQGTQAGFFPFGSLLKYRIFFHKLNIRLFRIKLNNPHSPQIQRNRFSSFPDRFVNRFHNDHIPFPHFSGSTVDRTFCNVPGKVVHL